MTSKRLILTTVVLALALTACAAGVNPEVGATTADGDIAGFWTGLWHGLIAPITFFISLFTDKVNFYEVHNNGNWYDFGFVMGAGMSLGGSCKGSRKR